MSLFLRAAAGAGGARAVGRCGPTFLATRGYAWGAHPSGWALEEGAPYGRAVLRATTILSVRKGGRVAVVGDGQVRAARGGRGARGGA
jgi:hypothetical protein